MSDVFHNGNTALITGAAMGIGRAAALRCASEGMKVVAVDTLADKLETLEAELAKLVGAENTMVIAADLGDSAALQNTLSTAVARFGAPDFLMNNAATRMARGHDAPLEDWRSSFEVNFWAVIEACRILQPQMQAKGGAIVNVGSKQGITNPPGHPIYNIAKSALKSYTELLEHELRGQSGPRVTAHLLIPGWTTTGEQDHRPGAWLPDRVVDMMIEGIRSGDFYILCPDDETTPEQDRKRILWGAGDITEGRPPLSRWEDSWKAPAKDACS